MKFRTIPTRRKTVHKKLFARLFNKPRTRKQRASAATASAEDFDESGRSISRSLTIIFAIHILAIGMIFIHKQYLSGRTPDPQPTAQKAAPAAPVAQAPERNDTLPTLSSGDKIYRVKAGDNYTIIARNQQVDETELRNLNNGADIRPGTALRIPQSRRIVAIESPEVEALRNPRPTRQAEQGLIDLLPPIDEQIANAPVAQVVRPNVSAGPPATSSGRTHTVKSGENIWRISNQYKVDQNELMRLNNITDPTRLRIGQELKIP